MIKLKLDSSKVLLNAQNTFVSAWLPGFTHHESPSVPVTWGNDDRRGEERERIVQKYRTFLFRQWHIEEGCNKASWGAEGERRRETRKRRK